MVDRLVHKTMVYQSQKAQKLGGRFASFTSALRRLPRPPFPLAYAFFCGIRARLTSKRMRK